MVEITCCIGKEAKMLLELNKPFITYTPIELIEANCAYREVYAAELMGGISVFLTVYDMDNLPKFFQKDSIKEFELRWKLKNEVFAADEGHTEGKYGGRSIKCMCTEYIDGKPLSELVAHRSFSANEAVGIACKLIMGIQEVKFHTNGGGHYNICPKTVLINNAVGDNVKVHLTGLEHASGVCNGAADFDTSTLDQCFRAPETFLGKFSPAADVYSLAMLIAYMIQKKNPFDIDNGMSIGQIAKTIRTAKPRLDVPDKLQPILKKALSTRLDARYESVLELGEALMDYMGVEKPKNFKCFSDDCKKEVERANSKMNKDKSEKMDEITQKTQEPRLNVDMSVRVGDGFKSVAGMEDIKKRLRRDFIEIVSHRELAKEFGIMPSNMLFYGAPGTGKTYITQKLAEECGLEYCSVKPSDLGSIWLHGSQGLIKDLFAKAEAKAKQNKRGCILLIDEFDALCGARDARGNEHQADEVAEWLTQLNDCVEKNVFVIGTTNCLDRIDKAIIRHGRIDQVLYVGLPDQDCRKQLFEIELSKRPHDADINLDELASITEGYTSSDISYMIKETARNAFEACLKKDDGTIVKISESMLRDVIMTTRPSVTREDVKKYEKMRDDYQKRNKDERPRIGFLA